MLDNRGSAGVAMKRILLAAALCMAPIAAGAAPQYLPGNTLAVPADYRQWVFLTASMDLNYNHAIGPTEVGMHMLDNVFVNPEAYKTFVETGVWPDKTMLVKENRMAESAGTLSKSGHFQAAVMNLEVHVKDEARFAGKWAFFVSRDGKAPGNLMPQTANCYSCHQAHGAVDTVFVQFYPTLIGIAQTKGVISDSYARDLEEMKKAVAK